MRGAAREALDLAALPRFRGLEAGFAADLAVRNFFGRFLGGRVLRGLRDLAAMILRSRREAAWHGQATGVTAGSWRLSPEN